MPSALAALSRHFPLSSVVAGVGATVLAPVTYWLCIQFPPPKQHSSADAPVRALHLLRDPVFLVAAFALAIQSGMEGMSVDWMPRYFEQVKLAGSASAEWKPLVGLSALTAAMMLARIALAILLTRIDSPVVLLASVGLTALGVATLVATGSYAASLASAMMIGAGLAAAFPIVLSYVGDRYPQNSGSAFSAIFTFALLGNMAVNKSFGNIADHYGVAHYSTMMFACLACSAVLLAAVVSRLRRTNHFVRTAEAPCAGASVDDRSSR
jgi:MFS transporter, FHS family, glucose/mannose:H+ symporter